MFGTPSVVLRNCNTGNVAERPLGRCWWRSDLLVGGVTDGIGVEFEAPITVRLGRLEAIDLALATQVTCPPILRSIPMPAWLGRPDPVCARRFSSPRASCHPRVVTFPETNLRTYVLTTKGVDGLWFPPSTPTNSYRPRRPDPVGCPTSPVDGGRQQQTTTSWWCPACR